MSAKSLPLDRDASYVGGAGRVTDRPAIAAAPMPMPGQPAPGFTLQAGPDRQLDLSQLRGAPVVLAFYPADWSPVCSDQMSLYQAVEPEFSRFGATVLGLSVDSMWCHQAFAASHDIRYPLLADFEPKGAVARGYGVYDEDEGTARRALFVLDDQGVVAWNYVSQSDVNPGADGILSVLEQLHNKRSQAAAS
jgi:peroxiredoxin